MTPDIQRIVADISKRFSESLKYLAQVDRNPEGEKPQALSAKHESSVVASGGDAPEHSQEDNNGLG